MLHEVGALLLDEQATRLVVLGGLGRGLLVLRVGVALLDRLDGLGLDARLRRVVDAARDVTVRVDGSTRLEESFEHGRLASFDCSLGSLALLHNAAASCRPNLSPASACEVGERGHSPWRSPPRPRTRVG